MKPKNKKPQQKLQTKSEVKKLNPWVMIAVGFVFVAVMGKFIIAAGIMSIIGFTSGKVVKRLRERREASC